MTYAFWIALAVVFIAIVPALLRRSRSQGKDGSGAAGTPAVSDQRRDDSPDDGNGGGDGGGD
ncbi:MAG: hypothetical protein ACK442_06155 [Novosphingobium sp.]|jgi:hypothetical protein|nr:hypothetical protein [Brevundimonas sp.]MCZ8321317.1 hypothetical protein [Novosphingobium sp.]